MEFDTYKLTPTFEHDFIITVTQPILDIILISYA